MPGRMLCMTDLPTCHRQSLTITCQPQDDKAQRTQTHQLFKEHFKNKLVTTTKDGSIVIRWWRPSDKNGQSPFGMHMCTIRPNYSTDKRVLKDEFAELGGAYLQFSLYKENKDTMEAINTLCKTCR